MQENDVFSPKQEPMRLQTEIPMSNSSLHQRLSSAADFRDEKDSLPEIELPSKGSKFRGSRTRNNIFDLVGSPEMKNACKTYEFNLRSVASASKPLRARPIMVDSSTTIEKIMQDS